jgi:hypothetical protein
VPRRLKPGAPIKERLVGEQLGQHSFAPFAFFLGLGL